MEILKDINFVQALIVALLGYVAWTFRMALADFRNSIRDLYEKYNHAETRLTRVETVHNIKGCDSTTDRRDGRP
jgi:Ca2+-dependent lipid-binding protein